MLFFHLSILLFLCIITVIIVYESAEEICIRMSKYKVKWVIVKYIYINVKLTSQKNI